MSIIAAENITIRHGARIVLKDVSMSISEREIVTIVGPNGSGKTTLLRALIGSQPLTQGSIRRASNLRTGYVPQGLHVDPALPITVARFLSLPRRHDAGTIKEVLSQSGADGLQNRALSELSGGQLQRVLLARALLGRPQLLLLDEPTTGLDQPGSAAFYRRIESLRQEIGCAVLLVSHELHVVMSASDRVICLNGHVCCEGQPDAVASAPEYRALFGSGTGGALALYRHDHDHFHDHSQH
ncbi:metal ABC transporter ATP-binding protein [Aestuariibius insulae]|uniref:metal ABC transporter ATP-binding protein n=1 Tax=Aestuariibius insulae TaxID=2058287 RepID=UPI00345EAE5A